MTMSETVPSTTTEPAQARSLPQIIESARVVPCGQCWAQPPTPCTLGGPPGYHLARFGRARRRGLISEQDMAVVVAAAGYVFGNATVIYGGPR
jgi:hypothetical protein